MASRLDRLFLLLETGSSPVTRKAAALQLGEVQKLHPHELHNLLARVRQYLHSPTWDTRIAAGQAVEAIISNVPPWKPNGVAVKKENSKDGPCSAAQTGRMTFSQFDINKVIQNGSDLLASEGKEYELDDTVSGMCPKERLAKQRQLLNKRLGLEIADKFGIDTSDIFSNDDLEVAKFHDHQDSSQNNKRDLSEVFHSAISQINPNIGPRKMNKSKRRASIFNKHMSLDMNSTCSTDCQDEEPPTKKRNVASIGSETSTDSNLVIENSGNNGNLWEESKEWPFESFSDELIQDLFSPSWEIRHGAATALREIVKIHGMGAGKSADAPADQLDFLNHLWLEDMALRFTCVLALDKFGDFISDQVIAPVRETCAQALGCVLNIMMPSGVEGVLHILLQLLRRPEWEARHGGLLGLKYALAVRTDMTGVMIPLVFEPVCDGLKDAVDDVSSVAASALVPVTQFVVHTLPHRVPSVVDSLWDALLDLDDLTSSTSSILMLLSSLLSFTCSEDSKTPAKPFNELIPRLWPFLSHNSSGVRKSVLEALTTLTSDKCSQPCSLWLPYILPSALRLVYQRSLVECHDVIHELLFAVWKNMVIRAPLPSVFSSACPYVSSWLSMLMQSPRIPLDPSTNPSWLEIQPRHKDRIANRSRKSSASDFIIKDSHERFYIGGNETLCDNPKEREKFVAKAKMTASKFLGLLASYIFRPVEGDINTQEMEQPVDGFAKLVLFHLNSKSALQRLAVALVLGEWAKYDKNNMCPVAVKERCLQCISENIYYDEIALSFTRMQQECQDFISTLKNHKIVLDPVFQAGKILTVEQALALATTVFQSVISSTKLKPKVVQSLEEKQRSLFRIVNETSHDQTSLNIMVQSALAGSLVSMKYLPEKLSPVIRPLMDSVKRDENPLFQRASASHLVSLMELSLTRSICPNAKIIKNLINFLCNDYYMSQCSGNSPSLVPPAKSADNQEGSTSGSSTPVACSESGSGIITLINMQKSAEKVASRKYNFSGKKNASASDVTLDELFNSYDEAQKNSELQRQGSVFVLTKASEHFGEELPQKLPKLWEAIFQPLSQYITKSDLGSPLFKTEDSSTQELICSLQVLEVVGPFFNPKLHYELESVLPQVCSCLEHPLPIVRHMAARALGMLSKVLTAPTMDIVLEGVLKNLGATDNITQRQGAVEAIACIIDQLGLDIVPYIVFLIVPMLGRMSDQNESVRLMSAHCFASLIKLMPLEGGIKDPPSLRPEFVTRKAQERFFLEQLMDPKKSETYKIPVPINAELRSYQQEGVNWLGFLNKYKLHGILCDDMGLGKTLQSICILAGDHYVRNQQYKDSKRSDCRPLPSLVVCPPTLTGHWVYEVEKFVSSSYLNPLHYTGPPAERIRLRSKAKKHNLVIASYDIVRNDIDFFGSIHWNYCILDEGHIIKNGKTKLARAIKQLSANHRLILTGTPIQNNVLELWSLFDFLMPGFLGTEKQFTARYSKPILQSRDAKSSSKEQEAGVLAMESLHRQVLPFLLRRMKEDVLQDLPPKIIQDYYCELSPLQVQLYEDFAKSRARQSVEDTISDGESTHVQGTSHIFQALQYLRKVCNHPKLVLSPLHPESENISKQLKQQNSNLSDIQHAAKLCALRQLLLDCGIGSSCSTVAQNEPEPVVSQHRALVFCQLKGMLDILENDLFKSLMPSVSYLRLDGSVPPGMRHAVVHRFNNDPSIDILLLTTQVGGLGLNLTGADTVIFVEHDWNPMKDLQAMDRAHRIGQKKVVNVYRLITRGTLEEKIMGLQKFKLSIANSVINQENTSLQHMGTDQLLDLFTLDYKEGKSDFHTSSDSAKLSKSKGIKSVLESLPDLWDTEQYETEYDLSNFLQSLKK